MVEECGHRPICPFRVVTGYERVLCRYCDRRRRWGPCVDFMSFLSGAAKYALHTAASAIFVCRVVDGKDLHVGAVLKVTQVGLYQP
jgi:hypothetical protein